MYAKYVIDLVYNFTVCFARSSKILCFKIYQKNLPKKSSNNYKNGISASGKIGKVLHQIQRRKGTSTLILF